MNGGHHRLCTTSLIVLCTSWTILSNAQETNGSTKGSAHPHHEVGVLLGHTSLSQGINAEGNRTWLVLPSWGLNYNYWFNANWALGLHTDIIMEAYFVDEHGAHGDEAFERSYPIAPALMVSYRPHHHWSFLLGAGEEFAREGNLFLLRSGSEYTIHLGKGWETAASLAYDIRLDAYDSWTFAFGVTRAFGK